MFFEPIDKSVLNKMIPEAASAGDGVQIWPKLDALDDKPLWEYDCADSVAAAVCENAVVVLRQQEVIALDIQNGKVLWTQWIPSAPADWGLAVDRDGRVIITLKNGQVICFG